MLLVLRACIPVLFLAACGGGTSTPAAPEPVPTPEFCSVDQAISKTAQPTPKETGCMDKEAFAKQGQVCSAGDAGACYQVGVCVKLQMMGLSADTSESVRVQHLQATLDSTRRACDAGMAKACLFRAGVLQEEITEHPERTDSQELAVEACKDSLRACQLGDEAGGCANCMMLDCATILK